MIEEPTITLVTDEPPISVTVTDPRADRVVLITLDRGSTTARDVVDPTP